MARKKAEKPVLSDQEQHESNIKAHIRYAVEYANRTVEKVVNVRCPAGVGEKWNRAYFGEMDRRCCMDKKIRRVL